MELLLAGASSLGISLNRRQQEQFTRYYQELVQWNRRMNLTSITEWEDVQTILFLDSLTVAQALGPDILQGGRVLDVGSGAGFPGIPLKIAFPSLHMGLLEARQKKVAFLRHLVALLGLQDVELLCGRAEELAHAPELREGFDVVLARGLAPMRALAELTLPFAKVGGLLVAQKKGEIETEIAQAEEALARLGGGAPQVCWLRVPGMPEPRALVVAPKVARTPKEYPRRPGMPAKHPLGSVPRRTAVQTQSRS